jgi:sec-independent protein translocase protein TatA
MNTLGSIMLFSMPGGGELMLLLFVIVLLFGAKKLPELARGMGRAIREFKDASKEIQKEIETGDQHANNK